MATAKKAAAKKTVVKRATAKKAPAKKAAAKAGRYAYEVEMNGQKHTGTTDTIARTIQSLAPDTMKTRMVTRFSMAGVKDGKVLEHVHNVPKSRRIFSNTMSADLYEKRVKLGLGDNG